MARKSLRPQLNQIRAWVRQGRTDAWIAHQLEISASELRDFRRQHDLNADEDDSAATEVDLRDEIEAEIEAAAATEEAETDEQEAVPDNDDDGEEAGDDGDAGSAEERPRRRRRRGRRGRGGRRSELEATFDHGTDEGYGLWLDPAVADDPVYAEQWAGHREVTVTVEADRIIIRRAGRDDSESSDADSDE